MLEGLPRTANLLAKSRVDVLKIWGSPMLNVLRSFVANLLATKKVDMMQTRAAPRLKSEGARLMCCKPGRSALNTRKRPSTLT